MERYQDAALSPHERALDLLPRMTLREKVGQVNQRLYGFRIYRRDGERIELTQEFKDEVQHFGGLGTLYGLYRADPWSERGFHSGLDGALAPKARNLAQAYVLEHSRLKIPMLMSSECPHGHQALDGYLLPVNLAVGATFRPALLEAAARVCGAQLRQMGVDLALVSALDILRDPRWGRSEECYGEDPLLASRFAAAAVRGFQSQGVGMVAKHLCGQGETTGGVNASAARIGARELREIHLPVVKACCDAGVAAFMAAYNEIDGVYCHANRALLTDLLRGEYGFEGFVMSDGVAIDQLDAMTGDRLCSGALAMNAGVDMGLWDTAFSRLEEAVETGLVPEARLDEAVRRILEVKFRLGLFEQPFVPENAQWQGYCDRPESKELASESVVLLKNDGAVLPLALKKGARILITGPAADALYAQLGDYTPPVRAERCLTVWQGVQALLPAGVTASYLRGCPMFGGDEDEFSEAVAAASECDAVIAVLGGSSSRFSGGEFDTNGALRRQETATMDCGENVDASGLRLPGQQLRLLETLHATGKPIVTVLIQGRPYEMETIDRCSDAILCAFYPGPKGGEAIAELLLGLRAPSGRLPVSLPDHVGQLPVYYNYKDSYRGMCYYDSERLPRYGFGCGLTYTSFAYTVERALPEAMQTDEIRAGALPAMTLLVQNTGEREADAVPQLYLHREQGVATSRVRQLCAFDKIRLAPGETKRVTLTVEPESLMQWDCAMRHVLPSGRIAWYLCDQGRTLAEGHMILK